MSHSAQNVSGDGIAQLVADETGKYILCHDGWQHTLPKWIWGGVEQYSGFKVLNYCNN